MEQTPYRVAMYGPGILAVTTDWATRDECLAAAPGLAVELQEEEGLRWCTWFVEPATDNLKVE